MRIRKTIGVAAAALATSLVLAAPPRPSTFSIVAADPEAGEVGVCVASRFFAVGTVVPFAKAGVGAVATQSFANTSYGPRGLDLLERGVSAEEVVKVLTRVDEGREQRQLGVVAASGDSATYSGSKCNPWAGGRHGSNYAVQGNILTGEPVVAAMEKAFLESKGKPLAERLYAAIVAGDAAGGDSRGRQSIALVVARDKGGYGGFTDRAIDLRVDDHPDPIVEMGRLLGIGLVNAYWNRGWTAFTEKKFADALPWQERAAAMAEKQPAVLPEVLYDLAVIRLAAGDKPGAQKALDRALSLNPKLAGQAAKDPDLEKLK
ncbi:MAG TPA: DUF1028 domain-containing protein [Candidatus Polarisedimenticolaceae bacterium]|nr:DUF1028 domain-containing protein [Candidatus Polarisedimenticolaceae bacterium]